MPLKGIHICGCLSASLALPTGCQWYLLCCNNSHCLQMLLKLILEWGKYYLQMRSPGLKVKGQIVYLTSLSCHKLNQGSPPTSSPSFSSAHLRHKARSFRALALPPARVHGRPPASASNTLSFSSHTKPQLSPLPRVSTFIWHLLILFDMFHLAQYRLCLFTSLFYLPFLYR